MFWGAQMMKNNLVKYRKTEEVKWEKAMFQRAQMTKNNLSGTQVRKRIFRGAEITKNNI